MRSKRPSSRSACSRTASGIAASAIFVRYSSTTDPSSSPSSLRIESICWRRRYSRCCFSMPGVDVLADPLADLHHREALALERERELEPLGDVDRLEQLDLLLEAQVGRVAGGVGERAGLADRAQERLDAAVVAAQLEDLLDDGAVLGLELAGALVGGRSRRAAPRPRRAGGRGVGLGGAGDAAVEPFERDGGRAAGQPDAVGHVGDGADVGVLALVLGHEQDALLVADVDRQRHVHVAGRRRCRRAGRAGACSRAVHAPRA